MQSLDRRIDEWLKDTFNSDPGVYEVRQDKNISLFTPFQAYPGSNEAYWWKFRKQEVHLLFLFPEEEENSILGKNKSCVYICMSISVPMKTSMWQTIVGFCLSNPWCISAFSQGRLHLHIEGFNQGKLVNKAILHSLLAIELHIGLSFRAYILRRCLFATQ